MTDRRAILAFGLAILMIGFAIDGSDADLKEGHWKAKLRSDGRTVQLELRSTRGSSVRPTPWTSSSPLARSTQPRPSASGW